METLSRRSLLIGATASLVTAPALVRAASLMPLRGVPLTVLPVETLNYWRDVLGWETLPHRITVKSMSLPRDMDFSDCGIKLVRNKYVLEFRTGDTVTVSRIERT